MPSNVNSVISICAIRPQAGAGPCMCVPGVENIADHGTIGPRKYFMLAERKKGRKKKGERKKEGKGKKEKRRKEK